MKKHKFLQNFLGSHFTVALLVGSGIFIAKEGTLTAKFIGFALVLIGLFIAGWNDKNGN